MSDYGRYLPVEEMERRREVAAAIERSVSECGKCDGRGWVVDMSTGGNGSARMCECRAVLHVPMLLEWSGMERSEISAAMEPWDAEAMLPPRYAQEFGAAEERDRVRWALVLLGKPGRGKTKAAAMAIRSWCQRNNAAGLWVNVPEGLGRAMRERLANGYSDLEQKIRSARFLVLDDLGFERSEGPRAEAVAEWVHFRHRRQMATVVTSNAEEVEQLGDARIASRLGEGEVHLMAGKWDYRDYRQERAASAVR